MTSAPFTRMFWKEYRSLRLLWIGCTLGTIALWGFIFFLTYAMSSWPNSSFKHELDSLLPTCWGFSVYLPAVYLIGCIAATFAGEREERTFGWLLNLAAPRGSTLAAKVIWPCLSATIMQWILLLLTFSIYGLLGLSVNSLFTSNIWESHNKNFEQSVLRASIQYTTFALLEALAWGVFYSTQTRKPMFAAIFSGGTFAVINLLFTVNSLILVNDGQSVYWSSAFNVWGGIRTSAVVLILVVDYFLAKRWLRGQPWEWSIPWDRFVAHKKFLPVAGVAVESGSAWKRSWKRLRWLEWQQLRLFLAGTMILACLGTIPIFIWPRDIGNSAVITTILCFLPMIAGLMAWSSDQSQQQFRFLAYRGVSPFGLWLNKLAVWVTGLLLAAAFVIGMEGISKSIVGEVKNVAFWNSLWISNAKAQHDPVSFPSLMHFLLGYASLFAAAFSLSLFYRRTVIAFGAAFLLQIALVYWQFAAFFLSFHWALSVLPVLVWILWCGWRQLPRWYLERTGWRVRAVIATEWLVFPLIFSGAMVAFWVYRVPMPNVQVALQPHQNEILTPKEQIVWDNLIAKVNHLAGTYSDRFHKLMNHEMTLEAHDSEIRAAREAILQFTPGFIPPKYAPSIGSMWPVADKVIAQLMDLAQRDLDAGRTEEAIRSVRAAVRFGGMIKGAIHGNETVHPLLHKQLTDWAASPANTPKILAQTLAELEKYELRWWITDPLELLLQSRARTEQLDNPPAELRWKWWVYQPAVIRERRILACMVSNQIRFLKETPEDQRNYRTFPPKLSAYDTDPAWNITDYFNHSAPIGLSEILLTKYWQRETEFRCTCAAIAAIAYRKTHGDFPNTLEAVVPQLASKDLLTDPYTGELLSIEPHGLDVEMEFRSDYMRNMLSMRVPFIWSRGPEEARIVPQGSGHRYLWCSNPIPVRNTPQHVYRIWLKSNAGTTSLVPTDPPTASSSPQKNPDQQDPFNMPTQASSLSIHDDQPADALKPGNAQP